MQQVAVSMIVNGEEVHASVSSNITLLAFLREHLHLTGTKDGCSQGHCGMCTVIVDGEATLSCLMKVTRAHGKRVETIEGLARDGSLHPLQKAFVDAGAVQCGFCSPAMIMAAKALLDSNAHPNRDDIKRALSKVLCRCTGYVKIMDAVELAAKAIADVSSSETREAPNAQRVIGSSVPRKGAAERVTGETKFAADVFQEGMLHGKIVWSEFPHAEILHVDTGDAENLPGVVKVLTSDDVPGESLYGSITKDQPVLAIGKVRCISEAVAVVFAESEATAEEACSLVKVEYHELETITSPQRALESGAPIIHHNSNVYYQARIRRGDVEKGFAESDVVVEGQYSTPFIEHAYMEPEAGLATYEPNGDITVWMGCQNPYRHRDSIAEILGLPPEKVRVVNLPMGGCFGSKNDMSIQPLLALGAFHTRRPVKMVLSRQESLRRHVKRHPAQLQWRLGATKDGRLKAAEARTVADTGAYASTARVVMDQAAIFGFGPYVIPNVKMDATAVYTNNIPAGAMRGFGIPQATFAMESTLDALARKLGLSSFEIRRLNGVEAGDRTYFGQLLDPPVPLKKSLDLVEEALRELPEPTDGYRIGVGIASSFKNTGLGLNIPDSASATVELAQDGSLLVKAGAVDLGQGSDTVLAQVAAATLGLPYERVRVTTAHVPETPQGGITSASRQTVVSGNAVALACANLKKSLTSLVAERSGCNVEDVELLNGQFISTRGGGHLQSIEQLAASLPLEGRRSEARYDPPRTFPLPEGDEPNDPEHSRHFFSYSFSTQGAVVEVNESSGDVRVRKIVAAHDVGKAINPLAVQGQIEGSCVMGMGYALSESFDVRDGRNLTRTLAKCGIPKIDQVPEIVPILIEEPDPIGPFGAKGIAEAAVIPTAPAIINAICDAVGVRIRDLPATRERVLEEIRRASNNGNQ